MNLINIQNMNPLKRALASLNIVTRQRYRHFKNISHIKNQDNLYDLYDQSQPSDEISFCYRLFDCTKEQSIFQFLPYSDRNIGGDSTS